jgi:hypothetical protein
VLSMQALHILFECTQEQNFAWHSPPRSCCGGILEEDRELWARMFQLSKSPLVLHLVQLWDEPFPGAASRAVHMFAFFTSWLRLHFCKDRRLLLSADILFKLQERSLLNPVLLGPV